MEKLFNIDFGVARDGLELKKIQEKNKEYDSVYVTTSCVVDRRGTKEWLEDLWSKYQHYAEPKFLGRLRRDSFHAYSWVMYVGTVILDKGLELIRNSGVGPDLQIKWGRNGLWIEAVVTTPGGDERAGVQLPSGDIYASLDPKVARIVKSFRKKHRYFKNKYEGKIVKGNEPFIVAINGTYTDTLMGSRAIEAAVFGRGNDLLRRGSDGKWHGGSYELREKIEISRKGDLKPEKINTDCFCNNSYKEISAVIYCEDHIINSNNFGRHFGENLYTAFNGYAKNRLSSEEFKIGKPIIRDGLGSIIKGGLV